MALPAVPGNTIYASDLYGLCQPSGGTDPGEYELQGWANAAGDIISAYIPSRSRVSTPVSLTMGSYTDSGVNMNTPVSTGHLDANGVQIYSASTGAAVSCHVGQYFTWQY
jgi:hypothetical protein